MTRPVLWIVLHDLDRTGVPVALARMLAWHRDHAAAHIHVVAGRDGPLAVDLRATGASVTALAPARGRTAGGAIAVGLAQAGRAGSARTVAAGLARHRTRHLPRPHVVLLHGAGAWEPWSRVAPAVAPTVRTVLHVHELATGLGRAVPAADQEAMFGAVDTVLAVDATTGALAGALAGRASIEEIPGVTDRLAPLPPVARPVRTVLGIGTAGWRKGTDRFVTLAHHLARDHPSVTSTWVGEEPAAGWRFAVGVDVPVRWDGPRTDPWTEAAGAVLVIPSREEPLPLVALEAGGRGVPVIATATGGLPGLLGSGRGLVVDGVDLAALAAAVSAVVEDPAASRDRAERLWHHVGRHHVAEVVGPRWLAAVLG